MTNKTRLIEFLTTLEKRAYQEPMPQAPPVDPNTGMPAGMPMDPSMMGGAPPMDPAMMGMPPQGTPMDPAMMGMPPQGAPVDPSMDPAMMGMPPQGAPVDPSMDPAMMGMPPQGAPMPDDEFADEAGMKQPIIVDYDDLKKLVHEMISDSSNDSTESDIPKDTDNDNDNDNDEDIEKKLNDLEAQVKELSDDDVASQYLTGEAVQAINEPPPPDASAEGMGMAPPMDPAMMGMPPQGAPVDPAMMGMPPQGAPMPMDPNMMPKQASLRKESLKNRQLMNNLFNLRRTNRV